MEWKPLVIGKKEARVPLIQGGMGVGISLGGLAGAVAAEGAVGIISAAQIGFREPDFDTDTLGANVRAIHSEMAKARRISPDGLVGFNIMTAMRHYETYVREAVRAGADIIISGAGLPTELPRYVEGSDVNIAPIVSSVKSAEVILKFWDRKYQRTADLVVIEGPEAGGHLGFSREQLEGFAGEQNPGESYEKEIQKIIGTVKRYGEKYGCRIPVIAAGGIADAEAVRRAFACGADGVQAATRFVTTEECDADIRYKEAYIRAGKEDIAIVKSPVGMPGRAILNPFIRRVMAGERISPEKCHGCLAKCNPNEIPYCITDALICAAEGDVDNALLFCGAHAYRAEKIETVKEVIASLMNPCV